jgi:hypothetical protein
MLFLAYTRSMLARTCYWQAGVGAIWPTTTTTTNHDDGMFILVGTTGGEHLHFFIGFELDKWWNVFIGRKNVNQP